MARFFRFLCLFCAQIPLTFPSLMIFAAWAFAVRGQASRRVSLPRTKSRVQREKLTYFPLLLHVLLPQSVVVCFPERGAVQGRAQRALEVKTGGRRGGRLAPVLPGRLDLVLRTGEKSFSLAPRPKCGVGGGDSTHRRDRSEVFLVPARDDPGAGTGGRGSARLLRSRAAEVGATGPDVGINCIPAPSLEAVLRVPSPLPRPPITPGGLHVRPAHSRGLLPALEYLCLGAHALLSILGLYLLESVVHDCSRASATR